MYTFLDDERYQLESNEANYMYLNAGTRLRSSFIPRVNTALAGGMTESLWEGNYGRRGLEISGAIKRSKLHLSERWNEIMTCQHSTSWRYDRKLVGKELCEAGLCAERGTLRVQGHDVSRTPQLLGQRAMSRYVQGMQGVTGERKGDVDFSSHHRDADDARRNAQTAAKWARPLFNPQCVFPGPSISRFSAVPDANQSLPCAR